jgi:uncharacterized protein (UPF0297 family)
MAIGLTTYEMAELLDVSQGSVSKAERELSCANVSKKEVEFLGKVYDVLDEDDRKDVNLIIGALMKWDSNKVSYKLKYIHNSISK